MSISSIILGRRTGLSTSLLIASSAGKSIILTLVMNIDFDTILIEAEVFDIKSSSVRGDWTSSVGEFAGTHKGPMIGSDGKTIEPTNKNF